MITLRHIEIYKKYNGDGDGFTRCATFEEKAFMDYKYWSIIENFMQDLIIIKNGLASNTFILSTNKKMEEIFDNKETIDTLKKMANQYNS